MKWLLPLLTIFLSGCVATAPKKDLSSFQAAAPRSILVVPTVNKSLDVDAPNYLLSTLPVPLAEKGFYVFPVHTIKTVLEQEGFYEGDQIHAQPPEALARMFGADSILYVRINRWDARYAFITTTVTVDFDYRIVYRDGTELWQANQKMVYQPQNNNNAGSPMAALVAAAINAAVTRAAPNFMPLAKQANNEVFITGPNAIPNGPYKVEK
jgi:hypothetical protein